MQHRRNDRGAVRRQFVIGTAVMVLLALGAVPLVGAHAGPSVPSSNINDYALFALRTLTLKGAGSVVNGNIGAGTRHYMPGNIDEYSLGKEFVNAKGAPAASGDAHVTLCKGANSATTVTGYVSTPSMSATYVKQVSKYPPSLLSSDPCQVPTVYTHAWTGSANIPLSVSQHIFDKPDVAFPTVDTFEPGIDTSCRRGTYYNPWDSMIPGVYGDVNIVRDTTLGPGDYTMCSLSFKQGVTFTTSPGTRIYIADTLYFRGGAKSSFGAVGTRIFVAGDTVAFGRNGTVSGTFVAPHADVSLGNSTTIHGNVWSLSMHSDWSITVTQGPPPTTTSTTLPPTTTPPTTTPPTTTPPTTTPPTTTPTTTPPTTTPPATATTTTTLPES